ncbi:NADH-quinone oxidoreductase subunit NuoN [Curvibacter sp. APW13]|uniref:NADH-quinone oxidoreductase subunit NuoN n=1 Tax=Curvibacter sp. APW13 TaxID=3077236 RepID=UPI0028E03CB2|nr:NADH-quinone oxidoreductase subunit NuoN [Curvibacter sp. APW13]MDT8991180.1 NADH-quinone oxidoreductase subunit NuoN [Curvibacter sp. APW13]
MIDTISLITVYPEAILLVMACVVALVDLGVNTPRRNLSYAITQSTLAAVALIQWQFAATGATHYGFEGMLVSDPMGNWLKFFATIAVMVTLVYARDYAVQRDMLARGGELFTLTLFSLLGMFVMISGSNLLVIYLGLELLTLAGYALVALRRDDLNATEAAMKYFVLGALASGFLLYGMSMLYGATGSLNLGEVVRYVASGELRMGVLVFGLVFIVAGLAFKLGVVPFHMWIPDVYHGAPTAITLMIGGAPKLAAFAIIMRLLVEGLWPLAAQWQQMLMFLAIASLLVGNLAAIMQTNVKRMLAFSTISQMGFVLLGVIAGLVNGSFKGGANAYSSAMFYIITYVLTTLASFGVLILLSRKGFESDELADLAGLNQRSPLYAGIMAACMFSLAGIPPMVGFYAKLSVLQALVVSNSPMYIALAVYAVIMSLIGAFYYLRVVKVMYFDAPAENAQPIEASGEMRMVLTVNGLLVLVLGLVPGTLMALCAEAVLQMLTT